MEARVGKRGPKPGTPQHPDQKRWHFQKGQSGNPSGSTREQQLMRKENAIKATKLRREFLDTLESRIATIKAQEAEHPGEADPRILQLLNADVNRLMTDSEDRGYGKATVHKNLTGNIRTDARVIAREMSVQEASEAYAAMLAADEDDDDDATSDENPDDGQEAEE